MGVKDNRSFLFRKTPVAQCSVLVAIVPPSRLRSGRSADWFLSRVCSGHLPVAIRGSLFPPWHPERGPRDLLLPPLGFPTNLRQGKAGGPSARYEQDFTPCHGSDRSNLYDESRSAIPESLSSRSYFLFCNFGVPATPRGKGWGNLFSGGRVLADRLPPHTNCGDNSSHSPGDTPQRDRTCQASGLW